LEVFPYFCSHIVRFVYKGAMYVNGLELWLLGVSSFVGEDG
jgi:hypothetical protein